MHGRSQFVEQVVAAATSINAEYDFYCGRTYKETTVRMA